MIDQRRPSEARRNQRPLPHAIEAAATFAARGLAVGVILALLELFGELAVHLSFQFSLSEH